VLFKITEGIVLKAGTILGFPLPIFCSHLLAQLFVYSVVTPVRNIRN